MKLGDLFRGEIYRELSDNEVRLLSEQGRDFGRALGSLVPGQTIQGEILSKSDNELLIKLMNDCIIQARVEAGIHLEHGQMVTFEVKNNGNTLTLSPLFTNIATDANVLKALEMAGLPVNRDSVEMTEQLMKAGLPIHRNMLYQVYREVRSFPGENISDIVNLHKLDIPVNESNLEQMSVYRNLEHQLTTGMERVLGELSEVIQYIAESGTKEQVMSLYRGLTGLPLHNSPAAMQPLEELVAQQPQQSQTPAMRPLEELVAQQPQQSQTPAMQSAEQVGEQQPGVQFDKPGEVLLQPFFGEVETPEKARSILGDKALQKLLLSALKENWTVLPKEVSVPKKLQQLYQQLDRQLHVLREVLEEIGTKDTGAFKAVTGLQQNIDFMNQLNQVYTYLQLPLRLHDSDTHGELYVYTNKKNLAEKKGEISALLHLDMMHLGPLDVYVQLQDLKVNTRFYVADETMLYFIEEHMDMLTQRLKKKGYDYRVTASVRGEEQDKTTGLQPFLGDIGDEPLVKYAFDMRA